MSDRPVDPTPPDEDADGSAESKGGMWAFLPIGLTFLVLGLGKGLGDGGTAFFAVGVAFMAIALGSAGRGRGSAHGGRGATGGGPDRPDDSAPSGPPPGSPPPPQG
ncbi:MAG: hypothetical protein KQH57_18340 [Actinomycetales bacterium]|nr:hypothetical protein [Actinomycetales bacterium]